MITNTSLLSRTIPVCLALTPIGLLFGILAGQQNLDHYEVLLLSIFGFSGSGQFAFLSFYQNNFIDIGYLTAFLLILSMNVRYIPMTLISTPKDIKLSSKIVYGHILSDESFATERYTDTYHDHLKIRLYIFFTWVISTLAGQILSSYIPDYILSYLNVSFPISAILFTLSFINIKLKTTKKNIKVIFVLFLVTTLSFFIFGERFFWIPAILTNCIIFRKFK
ncbi:AzlC family ABC transporter permease [Acinetobacter calcoaceticus]|uniref:AzlC family ABC transporter permease n=1 Tax=Acinetobacter calcoaceticus TaxID=471 RepID=UPI0005E9BF83|nr:AzlC family ABC transporter permease [Acinetobacter calcoaceticus]KJH65248.1 hypothetical protein UF12_00930 [Acinetobacter calcoaceticus]